MSFFFVAINPDIISEENMKISNIGRHKCWLWLSFSANLLFWNRDVQLRAANFLDDGQSE
tara:strand:+ start:548 stop:727 length:180 start_codon:yes stop_codon:yes gene_type:complete